MLHIGLRGKNIINFLLKEHVQAKHQSLNVND